MEQKETKAKKCETKRDMNWCGYGKTYFLSPEAGPSSHCFIAYKKWGKKSTTKAFRSIDGKEIQFQWANSLSGAALGRSKYAHSISCSITARILSLNSSDRELRQVMTPDDGADNSRAYWATKNAIFSGAINFSFRVSRCGRYQLYKTTLTEWQNICWPASNAAPQRISTFGVCPAANTSQQCERCTRQSHL